MSQNTSKIAPISLGAFGSISSDLTHYLSTVNLPRSMVAMMQRSVLLNTAQILRRYLNI